MSNFTADTSLSATDQLAEAVSRRCYAVRRAVHVLPSRVIPSITARRKAMERRARRLLDDVRTSSSNDRFAPEKALLLSAFWYFCGAPSHDELRAFTLSYFDAYGRFSDYLECALFDIGAKGNLATLTTAQRMELMEYLVIGAADHIMVVVADEMLRLMELPAVREVAQ
jgi:hypothetical protein